MKTKPFCNKLLAVIFSTSKFNCKFADVGTTTLGGGTAISGGGTPNTGGGTPFRPVPAEFSHCD